MEIKYIVEEKNTNKTINEILSIQFHFSTRLMTKLIKNKKISINGMIADTRNFATLGDLIIIDLSEREDNSNIVPTEMDLSIIYEDEWFLIVNKPAGIAIHPSLLHYKDSLSNGVKYYFDIIGLHKKIRPVNRLDSNTSGLVIFAKCEYIQEEFSKQMNAHTFEKKYLCFVEGHLKNKSGTINLPINRKPGSIIERCIDMENGQPSATHYTVVQEWKNYSLVKCQLETGRTHQIRVHMAALGNPLIGDTLYGNPSNLIARQALHSFFLSFEHPISRKKMKFEIDLPNDMKNLII